MNVQKVSGILSSIASLLIIIAVKGFAPVCSSSLELANGGVCMMKCHYYGIALFFFGVLLLVESILLCIGQSERKLSIVIFTTAVLILLLSNSSIGIGICAKAGMNCHKTALWGRIGAIISIVAAVINLFVHKSNIPQAD